jgi:hypothetical protein
MRLAVMTVLLILAPVAHAAAQPRVPDAEMWGIGGDFGVFVPQESGLDNAVELQAIADYYLTPRVSIRPTFGWTSPSFEGRDDDLRVIRLTVDLLYNWEGGKIHPFVGAGFGAYFLRHIANGGVGDTQSEPGFNLGGGIEYFTSRTVTVKGEGRYHIVNDDGLPDASGLSLTIGLKKYF